MLNRTVRSVLQASGCALIVTLLGAASANAGADNSVSENNEFCNAGMGYTVTASYVAGDDPGQLIVDGRRVSLLASGQTVIASSPGPAIVQRQISYVPGTTPITTLRVSVLSGAI
jgi:hypothetical protein